MVPFTLNASGGIVLPFSLPTQASRNVSIQPLTKVSDLPQAHKHGYIFTGWTLDGLPLSDADISGGAVNGNTVYAVFVPEYDGQLTTDEADFLALLDYDHVDYLAHYISEEIGNRITFSPRRDMCVDWLLDELESYGYEPYVQQFTAAGNPTIDGMIWIGSQHYAYYGPTYAASTVYQYDSSAYVDIKGAAVVNWANSGNAFILPAGDYAGKAVFVVTNGAFPNAANAYNAALDLQNAGAAAVMFQTLPMAANGNTTYSRLGNTTSGTAITIPVGSTLHYETSDILSALNGSTEVTLTLNSEKEVKNVIAKLPSATGSNKTIYITSHHDTTSSGPGLNDNGSGVIMSLEMARAWKKWAFEYNLVFVFFDSEESGSMRGSSNFCSGLTASERADFVANYNMDMIATSQANCIWMFMNITDSRLNTMQNAIPSGANPTVALADNPAAVAVAKEYEIYNTTMKAAAKTGFTDSVLFCYDNTTDHYRFVLNGMPNAVEYDWRSNRRGSGFETLYHRAGDTYALNFSLPKCKTQADIISLAIYDAAKGFRPIPVGEPVESSVRVDFPGVQDVTVRYYTNVSGWQIVGVFDDTCGFAIPEENMATWGTTTVQVIKDGMWYTFSDLVVGDTPLVLNVPLATITVIGIDGDCDLGLSQEDWIYRAAPAIEGQIIKYPVFDNEKK
jgi:Zn-dependent M28 family amino/carboxypeptidase